jgi:multidrug resistance efflux pump
MIHRPVLLFSMIIASLVGCVQFDDTPPISAPPPADEAAAQPAPDRAAAAPEPKPPVHKVEKAPFKTEASLKGIFETPSGTEIVVRTEAWAPNPLVVQKAVLHGALVRKGDMLIELDLEKINQAIKDLETDRRLAEVALKQADEEFPILEKLTPMELSQAERAKKIADEDLERFLKSDRPLAEEGAEQSLKNARNSLEYAKEELKQLQKMYRDKDIREDTEEIILKRQQNQVDAATFYVKSAEARRRDTLGTSLPRQEQMLKEAAAKAAVAFDKAKATLPLALNQKRLALEKLKYDSEKADERLARLKRDRNAMTVAAPVDGIVYYGKCVRGQWPAAQAMSARLVRGGMLQPEEVVMTIIDPRGLFVRATVEEKDLAGIQPGAKTKIAPAAMSDEKLAGRIDQINSVPVAPGSFEAKVTLDGVPAAIAQKLMPGMACTVKVTPYSKSDAVAVPASAVHTDEMDDDKCYVLVPNKTGKPDRRTVRTGKTSNGKIEILEGLQDGDEVLLDKPASSKKPAAPAATGSAKPTSAGE